MESEHSKNPKVQLKIAKEHIMKYGCGYYPALKKLETKLNLRRK